MMAVDLADYLVVVKDKTRAVEKAVKRVARKVEKKEVKLAASRD